MLSASVRKGREEREGSLVSRKKEQHGLLSGEEAAARPERKVGAGAAPRSSSKKEKRVPSLGRGRSGSAVATREKGQKSRPGDGGKKKKGERLYSSLEKKIRGFLTQCEKVEEEGEERVNPPHYLADPEVSGKKKK